jgi:hypothetical protein
MRGFGLSNCRDSASPLCPPLILLFAIRLMIFEIATGDKSLDLVIPVFRHCLGFWISRVLVFIVCLFEREREHQAGDRHGEMVVHISALSNFFQWIWFLMMQGVVDVMLQMRLWKLGLSQKTLTLVDFVSKISGLGIVDLASIYIRGILREQDSF